MIQRNNSRAGRLMRRMVLLASVATAGIAVLAGGPGIDTASNRSTWISSAAAAENSGWMGVRTQPVTADIAESLGLKKTQGALVAEPQSDSPAAKAGVLAGDVITAVNGNEVKDPSDLAVKIRAMTPGTEVKLSVQRKGEEKTLALTLGQQPDRRQANADRQQGSPFEKFFRQFGLEDMPRGLQDWQFGQNGQFRMPQMRPRPTAENSGWMGVRIEPVTADIADSLGLKKAQGALVAEPQSDSPAAKAGVLAGDVITAVNGNEVKDPSDLAVKIRAMKPGTEVKLSVQRKGEEKTLALTLGQQSEQRQANTDQQRGSSVEKFLREFGFEDMPRGMQERRSGQDGQFRNPQMQPRPTAENSGWMGVRTQEITADIADSLGLKKAQGALVAQPQSDSPAAKAGVLAGDVITAVNGNEVKDPSDLAIKIRAMKPGTEVKLSIQRKGEEKTLALTLGQQPGQRQANTGTDRPVTSDSGTPQLGLTLAPAKEVGGAGPGVTVTAVDPDGPAAEHGIKTGDVILDVAGQTVSKPEDVRQQLANLQKDGKRRVLIRVKSGDAIRFVAVALGKA